MVRGYAVILTPFIEWGVSHMDLNLVVELIILLIILDIIKYIKK